MTSPYDICLCGDYRRDHEGGTGACTFPAEQIAGHEPCRGFRLQVRSKAVGYTPVAQPDFDRLGLSDAEGRN